MNCASCKGQIYPTFSRKLDGYLKMDYTCTCGEAKPSTSNEPLDQETATDFSAFVDFMNSYDDNGDDYE